MGRWLIVAAILVPALAQGQAGAQPAPRTAIDPPIDIVLNGAPDAPLSTARAVDRAPATYAVDTPAAHAYVSDGWSLRATFQGRAMDLQSHDWSDDPHAQPRDIEAGYGWRGGRATALIGYEAHDYGPKRQQSIARVERDPNQPPPVGSPGVLGFSLVLHGR
jgi:hypothetical protein